MNTDSIKLELQQVLDQDLALRKEYNELKRSLSDYRNQLIMRDEDCKRLQVTIDVLNTKLLVIERDNTSYKAELASFKELRESIDLQLQSKQEEIELRLSEIESLKNELETVVSSYENKIQGIQEASLNEKESMKAAYENQIQEMRSTAYYRENGIRDEFENRLRELTVSWSEKEQSLASDQLALIQSLKDEHEKTLEGLRADYSQQLTSLSDTSSSELNNLREQFENQLKDSEIKWGEELSQVHNRYESEINALNSEKETLLQETLLSHENRVSELIRSYEEKLSNILIHSNAQNSKLTEEVERLQAELVLSRENTNSMEANRNELSLQLESLNLELSQLKTELVNEAGRYAELNSEFEIYRQNSSLSDNDKINELNYRLQQLNTEMTNMGLVFEKTTNQLAESEKELEAKNNELVSLQAQLNEIESLNSARESELEMFKSEFQQSIQDELYSRHLEYQKLLSENENLIQEIENAQRIQEGIEAELNLLRNELEQTKLLSHAKAEDFKETLSLKQTELDKAISELNRVQEERLNLQSENQKLQDKINQQGTILQSENQTLLSQISELRHTVAELEQKLQLLNETNKNYEAEIENLKSSGSNQEQDAFIDRLFKQIDLLNEQRLNLLDEKEQMAGQLLKMNEAIGSISQQVDNESIDVRSLNNHRKNIILADNSSTGNTELTGMKEQINNLVREIDKCIALLSA